MRHLLLALMIYAIWVVAPATTRKKFKRAAGGHLKAIAFIFLVLLTGLVVAFFVPSINLL